MTPRLDVGIDERLCHNRSVHALRSRAQLRFIHFGVLALKQQEQFAAKLLATFFKLVGHWSVGTILYEMYSLQ